MAIKGLPPETRPAELALDIACTGSEDGYRSLENKV